MLPFDPWPPFNGTVAAGGTFGALAAISAGVAGGSNLGAYILVAKTAGALSSLGISFSGGAAGATALVAMAGGPVTIAVALALGIGALVYSVSGRSWQSRLASQIAETLETEKVTQIMGEKLDALWNDTLKGFNTAADQTEREFEAHLARLIERLETPRSELEQRLKRVEDRRAFLSFIPWSPLGPAATS
jgi:hypothetical protein